MIDTFMAEVRAYCAARGIKPETLGYYAANNTRLFDAMMTGDRKTRERVAMIRSYMRKHPVQNPSEQTAPENAGTNQ